MKSVFMRKGTEWRVSSEAALDLHKTLPPGNYVVRFSIVAGFFLEQAESFELPSKLYGQTAQQAERILKTFIDRQNITGCLLEGEKGSGKTLLAKKLSVLAAQKAMPTLLVNDGSFVGDSFNQFIQSIEQPAILLFDEFEKCFSNEQQEQMLTFLDGVCPTKKLCILTVNNRWKLDSNLMNRPGRIFYMLSFKGLSDAFIREYCQDRLDNKKHIDQVAKIASVFNNFNFDQLQALVQEMNRYHETPAEALQMLNIKPESEDAVCNFDVKLVVDGKPVNLDAYHKGVWRGSPLRQQEDDMSFSWPCTPEDEENALVRWEATFETSDFLSLNTDIQQYTFKNQQGDVLTLTKQKERNFSYRNVF